MNSKRSNSSEDPTLTPTQQTKNPPNTLGTATHGRTLNPTPVTLPPNPSIITGSNQYVQQALNMNFNLMMALSQQGAHKANLSDISNAAHIPANNVTSISAPSIPSSIQARNTSPTQNNTPTSQHSSASSLDTSTSEKEEKKAIPHKTPPKQLNNVPPPSMTPPILSQNIPSLHQRTSNPASLFDSRQQQQSLTKSLYQSPNRNMTPPPAISSNTLRPSIPASPFLASLLAKNGIPPTSQTLNQKTLAQHQQLTSSPLSSKGSYSSNIMLSPLHSIPNTSRPIMGSTLALPLTNMPSVKRTNPNEYGRHQGGLKSSPCSSPVPSASMPSNQGLKNIHTPPLSPPPSAKKRRVASPICSSTSSTPPITSSVSSNNTPIISPTMIAASINADSGPNSNIGLKSPESHKRLKEHTNKGCSCKKTGCLKRYCECFQNGVLCSSYCKCQGCKNYESSPELLLVREKGNVITAKGAKSPARKALQSPGRRFASSVNSPKGSAFCHPEEKIHNRHLFDFLNEEAIQELCCNLLKSSNEEEEAFSLEWERYMKKQQQNQDVGEDAALPEPLPPMHEKDSTNTDSLSSLQHSSKKPVFTPPRPPSPATPPRNISMVPQNSHTHISPDTLSLLCDEDDAVELASTKHTNDLNQSDKRTPIAFHFKSNMSQKGFESELQSAIELCILRQFREYLRESLLNRLPTNT